MDLQYIHDNKGNTTGVFIPIEEWQMLKKKYDGLQEEELSNPDIPEWQQNLVLDRVNNPQIPIDAFRMLQELEEDL
jgi:hypothetical protein